MAYRYTAYRSPIGTIYLLAGEKGLLAVSLGEKWEDFKRRYQRLAAGPWEKVQPARDESLRQAIAALQAYFRQGKSLPAGIPLDPQGTQFQKKVWAALRRIPLGKTVSYGEIAKRIGKPHSARAVGGACGSNPLPLFVPCHRVIAGDQSLGGFGGGLEMKVKLLSLEGARPRP